MSSSRSIQEDLLKITEMLKNHSETPRLDAELLMTVCTNESREYLLTHAEEKLTLAQEKKLNTLVQRRIKGEPIAYILGHKEFWSLNLFVNKDVLIPRPETEHLIEWALENLPANEPLLIADLGVGSGAIALTLASERPHWKIHATDSSIRSLFLARRNAIAHQLFNIRYHWGDWCNALHTHHYNAIFSNPPYIPSNDPHLEQLKFEPRGALDGGQDGLDAIRIIISQAQNYLIPGGALIIEHGYDQEKEIITLMQQAGYENVQDHKDIAGLPRYVTGFKPNIS